MREPPPLSHDKTYVKDVSLDGDVVGAVDDEEEPLEHTLKRETARGVQVRC